MADMEQTKKDFQDDGYAIIANFLTDEEVESMKRECKSLIDKMDDNQDVTIFTTGDSQKANQYFMNSADKISYFYEKNAFDQNGKLVVDKYQALNKIGHAMHWLSPVFKNITFSEKVKQLVKNLGLIDPVVVQSMYIFKNPGVGGEVVAHQDATFLHSTPDPKVIGLWFALEDATTENGCLSFIPGSHKQGLHNRWVRTSDEPNCTMKMIESDYKFVDHEFVSAPVSKGSCVIIDGLVVHQSDVNRSKFGRPIYTFHIFDRNGRQWDSLNWLQPSSSLPFPSLFNN